MNKKILVIIIGLFVLTASIVGTIFLSHKDQKIFSKPINLNRSGVCNIDSDCIKIQAYNSFGCAQCNSYAGNSFDKKNYTFGKPSNFKLCPELDCLDPNYNKIIKCLNHKCAFAEAKSVEDCNNVSCLLNLAAKIGDVKICEKIKALYPDSYSACLFQFAQSAENCNELSKTLNIPLDSEQTTRCFVLHAKTNADCNLIQRAYEKNKCLANTATKIRECEFIDPTITEKDPNDYRSWCYTRTKDAIPESIDDCNLLLSISDWPVNCINNFVKQNLSKTMLMDSCYKLKNKKSIDYCLSQVN